MLLIDDFMLAMDELRIRIKIGEDEFEFQGPPEAVDKQFEPFRLALMPAVSVAPAEKVSIETKTPVEAPVAPVVPLERVVQVHGSICSLRISTKMDDAILVILLAQRTF